MRKLYFLGGEDIVKRDSEEINKKAIADAGGAPVVLIFPWTAESVEKENKYRKIMTDYFKDLGAKKIEFAELLDSLQEITEKVDASDLIYLPGGDTTLLIKRIKDVKVDSLLRKYNKVIIGNSAGALALCKNYAVIKGQDDAPKTGVAHGLGLVDFGVSVHYKSLNIKYSGQSPDKELKALSEKVKTKIYAIPEQCALIYDNGSLKFIGNIYLFYKGKKKMKVSRPASYSKKRKSKENIRGITISTLPLRPPIIQRNNVILWVGRLPSLGVRIGLFPDLQASKALADMHI